MFTHTCTFMHVYPYDGCVCVWMDPLFINKPLVTNHFHLPYRGLAVKGKLNCHAFVGPRKYLPNSLFYEFNVI